MRPPGLVIVTTDRPDRSILPLGSAVAGAGSPARHEVDELDRESTAARAGLARSARILARGYAMDHARREHDGFGGRSSATTDASTDGPYGARNLGAATDRVIQRALDDAARGAVDSGAAGFGAASPAAGAPPTPTGAGAPLQPAVRAKMEGAFGDDFADVRIHEGEQAGALGAEAYTQGKDVHFAPGRYDPASPAGQELIGHELSHVVQQREGRVATPQGKGAPINADAALEAEADRHGADAAAGRPVDGAATTTRGAAAAPIQRQAAPIQRRPIRLGTVGGGALVDTAHLGLTADQIEANLHDPTLPAAARGPLERAQRRLALHTQTGGERTTALQTFTAGCDGFLATYPNVAPGGGVAARVGQLGQVLARPDMDDCHVEDCSATVFGYGDIAGHLAAIDARLGSGAVAAADATRAKDMIADLLIFSSLVLYEDHNRKFFGDYSKFFSRYSLEVLSPATVASALRAIRGTLAGPAGGQDIHAAPRFASLGLDDGDVAQGGANAGDNVTQRMLKLSLLNTSDQIQQALQNDALFQSIAGSDKLARIMLTSTGADEQHFLNTCPISARNTEMGSHAMSIAPLLQAGRNLCTHLQQAVTVAPPAMQAHLTHWQTVGQLVQHRVTDATQVFDAIDLRVRTMLAGNNFDEAALKDVRQQWSRAMQKLGGVVNWRQPDEIPHLSKKVIKDHWGASAVPALLAGLTVLPLKRNTRTLDRVSAPDAEAYAEQTDEAIPVGARNGAGDADTSAGRLDHHVDDADGGATRTDALDRMQTFWVNLFRIGGTSISQPHLGGAHALFMKAIQRGGVKMIAINDPKWRAFQYFTLSEMEDYLRTTRVDVPTSLLT